MWRQMSRISKCNTDDERLYRRYPRRRARRLPERGPYYATMEAASSGHLHIYVSIFDGAERYDR